MVASATLLEPLPEPKPILALGDLVHDLFRATLLRVHPVLAEEEITMGQFWALHTLSALKAPRSARSPAISASPRRPSAPSSICSRMRASSAGPIREGPRTVVLSLTPRGRRVEARVWREIAHLMSDAAVKIPERDLLAAVRVFRTIIDGLQPDACGRREGTMSASRGAHIDPEVRDDRPRHPRGDGAHGHLRGDDGAARDFQFRIVLRGLQPRDDRLDPLRVPPRGRGGQSRSSGSSGTSTARRRSCSSRWACTRSR